MSRTLTEIEFRAWEVQQPLRFDLVKGLPVRLADGNQGQSRLARVRQIARQILTDHEAVLTWMTTPLVSLDGQKPEAAAAASEEGCQLVLRSLVAMSRRQKAHSG